MPRSDPPLDFLWKRLPTDGAGYPTLKACYESISYRSLSWRKAVILCCRAQLVPPLGSQTRLSLQIGFSSASYDVTLYAFLSVFSSLVESPLYSALVLDMCRTAPLTPEDVKQAKLDSFGKEISVIGRLPFDAPRFNYRVWFEQGCEVESFHYSIPPNPQAALYVRNVIDRWITKICAILHYPRLTNKKIARSTIREWEEYEGVEWDDGTMGEFTLKVVEEYYHRTGRVLGGSCEMRQKWYRSGVTPRTYYAQGGAAFALSKHCHGIFRDLTDAFPVTNHLSRLNPTRIRLRPDEYLRIYDLSSFTSNYSEHRHFIDALANYCVGNTIRVVDARDGEVHMDLGELLRSYNAMNQYPLVSLERVVSSHDPIEIAQNIAGFLGVFGNITSCTFPHGASLLQVITDPDRANCAGDDVHYAERSGMEDTIDPIIRTNGVVEQSKEFATYEEGAVCLKRGLIQIENKLLQKIMVIWPSLSSILELLGSRPKHHPSSHKTRTEMRSSIGSEIMRFLRSLYILEIADDHGYLLTLLRNIYDETGLPREGSVPQLGGSVLCPILPVVITDLSIDPLRLVLSLHYQGAVTLPVRELSNTYDPQDELWIVGYSWFGFASSKLSYFETLGYVASEPVKEVFWGADGYCRLVKEFDRPGRGLYQYTCIRELPSVFLYLE